MSDYETAFHLAVDNYLTCSDCAHCQINKKIPNRVDGYYCYHDDAMQTTLHSPQPIQVNKTFLCNRFEIA